MTEPTLPPIHIGPMRPVDQVVIHCSATPSGQWLRGARGTPGFAPAVAVIDQWHAQRGFRRAAVAGYNPQYPHLGYHYVIDLDGIIDTGRHLREVGAHVQGHNAKTIGICMVGGAEREAQYTQPQWASLAALVRLLTARLPLPLIRGRSVCGHRDLSPDANGDGRITQAEWVKTCPGFDVGAWLMRDMQPLPDHLVEMPA